MSDSTNKGIETVEIWIEPAGDNTPSFKDGDYISEPVASWTIQDRMFEPMKSLLVGDNIEINIGGYGLPGKVTDVTLDFTKGTQVISLAVVCGRGLDLYTNFKNWFYTEK